MAEVLPNLLGEYQAPRDKVEWRADVFSEYGTPMSTRARQAMAKAITRCAELGISRETVLLAARSMKGTSTWPGRILQEAERLHLAGGPCSNGEQRSRLTRAQLSRCTCRRCQNWLAIRERDPLPFDMK